MTTRSIRLACAALCAALFTLCAPCVSAASGEPPASLTAPTSTAAPLRAVAEDGRRVLLLPDGSWRFDAQQVGGPTVSRGDLLGSPYRTAVKRFTLAYDTNQWAQLPTKEGEESKRSFKHRSLPVQAMVIADEFPANNASLHNVILHNARSVGATVTVLIDEERTLQARQIGNVQVTCFTAQSLFTKVQAECQRFIDGLTIQ